MGSGLGTVGEKVNEGVVGGGNEGGVGLFLAGLRKLQVLARSGFWRPI
jgi:hypothetical protein